MSCRWLVLTCIAAFSFSQAQDVSFIPQFGDGADGDFRLRTSILLVNTGPDGQAQLDFFDSAGNPLVVQLPPLGSGSSFSIPLESGQALTAQTPGLGALTLGYARLQAPSGVGGTAVFTGIDQKTDTVLFEAGVPVTPTFLNFTIAVDSIGPLDTGVAIVNPSSNAEEAAAGLLPASDVLLTLFDEAFTEIASTTVALAPGERQAKFVWEFFQDDSPQAQPIVEMAREMRGSLIVSALDGPVAATVLRQRFGDPFPGGVTTLAAFPVVEGAAATVSSVGSQAEQRVIADTGSHPSADVSGVFYRIVGSNGKLVSEDAIRFSDEPLNHRLAKKLSEAVSKDGAGAEIRWVYIDGRVSTPIPFSATRF